MNKYLEKYIGRVVANNDPTMCERVKVVIPSILEGDANNLPWVCPNIARSQGQAAGIGVFGVPVVGAKVYVSFQGGDPDFPVYEGGVVGVDNLIPEAAEDYPHCWGFVDAKGNKAIYNTKTGVTRIIHNSGTTTRIEADGTVNEVIVKDYNVSVTGDYTVTVGGSASISASSNASLSGGGNASLSGGGAASVAAGSGLSLSGAGMSMDSGSGTASLKGNFEHEGNISSSGNLSVAGNITATGSVHGSNI